MKNLDCNQIKIFINLKIIREKDKDKKYISIFLIQGLLIIFQIDTTIIFVNQILISFIT